MPELVCYRAAAYRTPTRVRAHDRPGRYHRADSPPTQYFALHPLGPWAELLRNRGYSDPEHAMNFRIPIWAVRLVLAEEPARLDFDLAAAGATPAQISPEGLISDDQSACRDLADAVRAQSGGPRVLRVPSAALPGAENIVAFGPRATIEYLRAPRRPQQVPAAVAAVDGRALAGLLPLICHRGRPHAAYAAWVRGDTFRLPEADTAGL